MTQLFRAQICSLASLLKTFGVGGGTLQPQLGGRAACHLLWLPRALKVKPGRVFLPGILMPSNGVGRKAT